MITSRDPKKYDHKIFATEEDYKQFLLESIRQFCGIKFGDKAELIAYIDEELGANLPKSATYEEVIDRLQNESVDFYEDVLDRSSAQ